MSHENEENMKRAEDMLELCRKAPQWYSRQTPTNKRLFLKLICSNFYFDGEKCSFTIKNTFKPMFEGILSNMVGIERQSSNFLHWVKTLVNTMQEDINLKLFKRNKLLLWRISREPTLNFIVMLNKLSRGCKRKR